MNNNYNPEILSRVKNELAQLDMAMIDVDGVQLKPSQCYTFGLSPTHVLFNTNCPDSLKQRIESIISKYTG